MNFARSFRALLAVALLAAWQSALVHPIVHVDADGDFVHIAGGHSHSDPQKKSASDPLCDAIAAVAIFVGGALPVLPATDIPHALFPEFWHGVALNTALPAYRSQAPPQYS